MPHRQIIGLNNEQVTFDSPILEFKPIPQSRYSSIRQRLVNTMSITTNIWWQLLLANLLLISFIWITLRTVYRWRLLSANRHRRKALLDTLGYAHGEEKRVVGFFHPYW